MGDETCEPALEAGLGYITTQGLQEPMTCHEPLSHIAPSAVAAWCSLLLSHYRMLR